MISAVIADRVAEAVVVDYRVDGDRTAVAVARGDSALVAVAIAGQGIPENYVTDDVEAAVRSLGDRPRVYADALFARTVERAYSLPSADCFDDVGAMLRLLDVAGLANHAVDLPPGSPQDEVTPSQVMRLFAELPDQLTAAGLGYVYASVELPVADSVVDMIINGLPVDTAALTQIETSTAAQLDILRHQIAELTGGTVNPDNDNEIGEFLYDHCGLRVPFQTPSGSRSVCKTALRQLDTQHPIVSLVQDYRSQKHTLTTCQGLLRNHCDLTNCVHGTIDPLGAATGRFSCNEPNLHGVPHSVRRVVCARPGMTLIEGDITQAEIRVLAHFTRDPALVEAFQLGSVDLHKQTMALALDKAAEEVTPEERKIGKAVGFGIMFGETEIGLSRQLGVSVTEARGHIDGFFRGHPAVYDWIEAVKQQVHRDGYVQTLSGRRRSLPAIWSSNPAAAAKAERRAVNTIVQGSAADLMKLMLVRLRATLPDDCRLLLTVHDSILLAVPSSRVQEVSGIVRLAMESPLLDFSIPIKVDVQSGADWAACKPD